LSCQSELIIEVADIINMARLICQEKKTGSIEADERVGIMVLDQSLLDIPASQINDATM